MTLPEGLTEFDVDYLKDDLENCKLCHWQCGVDRLNDELGICGITIPEVASSQLHPAPPASFDAFLTGCSFRCISCQNWPLANYPENSFLDFVEGYYHPQSWAASALAALASPTARRMNADRLFFTGGEPTCSLPWLEKVVSWARELDPGVKVNFDTNGFMTEASLARILSIVNSITFDIKAFEPKLFSALTGAEVEPVLRNAEYIAKHSPEKIWEFRLLVIPYIHDEDLEGLCGFIAGLGTDLPVNFLAFRPEFVMRDHCTTPRKYMEKCVGTARKAGLENVSWSGRVTVKSSGNDHPVPLPESIEENVRGSGDLSGISIALDYASNSGCIQKKMRNCGQCSAGRICKLKRYTTKK